jgi:hypothetical protein
LETQTFLCNTVKKSTNLFSYSRVHISWWPVKTNRELLLVCHLAHASVAPAVIRLDMGVDCVGTELKLFHKGKWIKCELNPKNKCYYFFGKKEFAFVITFDNSFM